MKLTQRTAAAGVAEVQLGSFLSDSDKKEKAMKNKTHKVWCDMVWYGVGTASGGEQRQRQQAAL